ncbi:MAG: AbrB/MazE/SpoVT family DNA-binding domain-containing protein [Rhodoferax sp.]|nr:AbrB/MazE/SpoVT family DNA-binding domain-containing protein [Rhodoferax sp.]
MQTTITSKGQVTIPRDVRQHFGLQQGFAVAFSIVGDHIELRPAPSVRANMASGFGLIQSNQAGIPADFDVASLAIPTP